MRSLAHRLLRAAVARSHPDARDWAQAMLREMDFIASDWAALAWSLGCTKSIFRMRHGRESMRGQQINRASSWVIAVLSLIAFVTVVTGFLHTPHQPELDEGTGAHIFQISIALIAATFLFFLATADWKNPLHSARPLTIPAVVLAVTFAALYYLEHFYLAPL